MVAAEPSPWFLAWPQVVSVHLEHLSENLLCILHKPDAQETGSIYDPIQTHTWLKFCSSCKTYPKGHLLPGAYSGTPEVNLASEFLEHLILPCVLTAHWLWMAFSHRHGYPHRIFLLPVPGKYSMRSSPLCSLQRLTFYLAHFYKNACQKEGEREKGILPLVYEHSGQ